MWTIRPCRKFKNRYFWQKLKFLTGALKTVVFSNKCREQWIKINLQIWLEKKACSSISFMANDLLRVVYLIKKV